MKRHLLLLIVIAVFKPTCAQDAKTVLIKSQQAVSEIKSCSYLIYGKTKVTGMRDTLYQTGKCSFINISGDSVLGRHIYIENFSGVTEVYNGDVYFKSRKTDSTVYIWDARKFNFFKQQFATNPVAYSPLINRKNIYTQLQNDKETMLTLLVDTLIGESLCYHIKTLTKKLRDNIETGITIAADLFIRKADFIPMGHVQLLQSNISNAINNYESYFLEDLAVNKPIDENIFSLTNIPVNYTHKQQGTINIKNFIVAKEQIPDFDLSQLKTDGSFRNIQNKNVVLCFIEPDECFPCQKSLTMLEELYQNKKSKNLGVFVVSADTVADDFKFLTEQRKAFPSLFKGQKIIEKTGITVFPTFFIFNNKGEQVYKNEGFNQFMKEELEKEIDVLPEK